MSYPGGGETRDDVYGAAPLVTGDAVILELRPAGFATRAASLAIDVLVQVITLLAMASEAARVANPAGRSSRITASPVTSGAAPYTSSRVSPPPG